MPATIQATSIAFQNAGVYIRMTFATLKKE